MRWVLRLIAIVRNWQSILMMLFDAFNGFELLLSILNFFCSLNKRQKHVAILELRFDFGDRLFGEAVLLEEQILLDSGSNLGEGELAAEILVEKEDPLAIFEANMLGL